MYKSIIKPAIDEVIAALSLVLVSPIILLCIILLFTFNKGRVWFIQERPGFRGRPLKVIKFRTMTDERNEAGELLPDEKRLTGIGKIIRKTSLDELPQLFNVLIGNMSMVGPRPLLTEYLSRYDDNQKRRHEVKPGMTGWAQVNGRNTITWQKKFEYDVWYVDHLSLALDLKILFLTVVKVLQAEGINSHTSVTMEKFKGN